MKRSQLLLATLALPLDYIMLILAGLAAYQLRFITEIQAIKPIIFQLPLTEFLPKLMLAAVICLILFALAGLYSLSHQLKLSEEMGRIFLACSSGLALIILFFFFNFYFFSSRFIVLAGFLLAFIFTALGRIILRFIKLTLTRNGYGINQVIIIGDNQTSNELVKTFTCHPSFGFKVLKQIAPNDFYQLVDISGVDEIIIGDPNLPRDIRLKILEFCTAHHLGFRYVADLFEAQAHNVIFHTLAGVPLVEIKKTTLEGWGKIVKRLFDIFFSILLLIILLPIFIIIGLIVMIDSGRPIFIGLTRIGEKDIPFKLYKFRSMVRGADRMKAELLANNERSDGPLFKMSNDPRVTKFGKFIRRWSLDELPQLINIIKGEMSLVGPRPHEPAEVAKYQTRHHKLLNIKPGLTGLGQVAGRSQLTFEEEFKLDTFYVENWTLGQDMVILAKTIIVVLQRKAAV